MRRSVLLFISVLLVLTSCGSEPLYPDETARGSPDGFIYTESDDKPLTCNAQNGSDKLQFCNGCLYFSTGLGTEVSPTVYMRYNCSTGNLTSVCSDPVCRHDSEDCPLYGLSDWVIVSPDENIFFLKKYIVNTVNSSGAQAYGGLVCRLMEYDARSGQIKLLQNFEDGSCGFSNELYTGEYRFYHDMYYDKEQNDYIPAIMRMSLDTFETIPFAGIGCELNESYAYSDDLLFILGDRIYLTDSRAIYSLDFNGENRVDCVSASMTGSIYTDGEYIFYENEGELCRRALDGGGEERLGIYPNGSTRYYITEKYIYYISGEDVVLGKANIYGYASDTVTLHGSEFRRCLHDGSGDERVFAFEDAEAGIRPLYWLAAGNYIYCFYTWWTDSDGDGVYEEGDNGYSYSVNGVTACTILRIDVSTGEAYYIKAAE